MTQTYHGNKGLKIRALLYAVLSFLPPSVWADSVNTSFSVWANEAIVATYTYNFNDFLERQKEIAKYFTAQGWMTYSAAFNESNLPEMVKKHSYSVRAVALMPPEIKRIRDNYWQATMPVIVVYKNPQYQQKQTLEVTIGVTKALSGQGVRGLAITNLQSKIIEPPCRCDNETKLKDKE